jgi:hypothetical protein
MSPDYISRISLPTPLQFLRMNPILHRPLPLHKIHIHSHLSQPEIPRPDLMPLTRRATHRDREIMREPEVKRHRALDLIHVLLGQLHAQGLNVAFQMLDLPSAADGEDVGGLVHDVREGDAGDDTPLSLGNPFKDFGQFELRGGSGHHIASVGIGFTLLLGFEVAASERTPGAESHAFGAAHRDDIAFEIPRRGGPSALVGYEWAEAVGSGIFVRF